MTRVCWRAAWLIRKTKRSLFCKESSIIGHFSHSYIAVGIFTHSGLTKFCFITDYNRLACCSYPFLFLGFAILVILLTNTRGQTLTLPSGVAKCMVPLCSSLVSSFSQRDCLLSLAHKCFSVLKK